MAVKKTKEDMLLPLNVRTEFIAPEQTRANRVAACKTTIIPDRDKTACRIIGSASNPFLITALRTRPIDERTRKSVVKGLHAAKDGLTRRHQFSFGDDDTVFVYVDVVTRRYLHPGEE